MALKPFNLSSNNKHQSETHTKKSSNVCWANITLYVWLAKAMRSIPFYAFVVLCLVYMIALIIRPLLSLHNSYNKMKYHVINLKFSSHLLGLSANEEDSTNLIGTKRKMFGSVTIHLDKVFWNTLLTNSLHEECPVEGGKASTLWYWDLWQSWKHDVVFF